MRGATSAFAIICIFAISLTAAAKKQVTWVEEIHDFAVFNEDDGKVTVTFAGINTGDEPVQIISARSTCGCTRPSFDSRKVSPGDTVKLQVSYDPAGRPGRFDKKIYVDLDTDPTRHTLHVKGTVIGNTSSLNARYPIASGRVRLQKDMLMFGEMTKGAIKSEYVEFYNVSTDTLSAVLSSAPSYIHLLTSPEHVPPGEQAILSTTLYSVNIPQYGLLSDFITVEIRHCDGSRAGQLNIPVTAFINEDFSTLSDKERVNAPELSLSIDKIDLGNISLTAGLPLKHTVQLTNSGKNALTVRRLYTTDDDISVTINKEKVKKGDSATVTVTILPEALADKEIINTSFVLITNDPANPVTTVRVVGIID